MTSDPSSTNPSELEKPIVIFVDDDAMLLASTRRRVRKKATEWDIHFANSGQECLEICRTITPDVVVSDMRMPEMDGAELLAEIHHRFPFAFRIILSGQSEEDQLAEAQGSSHLFLSKPCDIELLSETIQRCVKIRSRLKPVQSKPQLQSVAEREVPDSIRQALHLLRDVQTTLSSMRTAIDSAPNVARTIKDALGCNKPARNSIDLLEEVEIEELKSLYCASVVLEELPFERAHSVDGKAVEAIRQAIDTGKEAAAFAVKHHASQDVCDNAFLGGLISQLVPMMALSKEQSQLSETEQRKVIAFQLLNWGFDPQVLECLIDSHEPDPGVLTREPKTVADCVQAVSVNDPS